MSLPCRNQGVECQHPRRFTSIEEIRTIARTVDWPNATPACGCTLRRKTMKNEEEEIYQTSIPQVLTGRGPRGFPRQKACSPAAT
jgi:hypothetical protein